MSVKTCSEKKTETLSESYALNFFLLLILSISILVFLTFLTFAKQPIVLVPDELFTVQRDSEKN